MLSKQTNVREQGEEAKKKERKKKRIKSEGMKEQTTC